MTRSLRSLFLIVVTLGLAVSGCSVAGPVALKADDEQSASPTTQTSSAGRWNEAPAQGDCFLHQAEKRGDFFLSSQVHKVPCSDEHSLEVYAPPFYEADGKDDYVDRCADVIDYGGADLYDEDVLWAKRLAVSAIVGKTELNGTVPVSCTWAVVEKPFQEAAGLERVTGSLRGIFVAPDAVARVGLCMRGSRAGLNPKTTGACKRGAGHWLVALVIHGDDQRAYPGEAALRSEAAPKCRRYAREITGERTPETFFAVQTRAGWKAGNWTSTCAVRYDAVKPQ